jgi:hypothetical protein
MIVNSLHGKMNSDDYDGYPYGWRERSDNVLSPRNLGKSLDPFALCYN